jgi:hypothetical protein
MGSSSKGYLLIRERFLILDRLEILSSGQQCLQIIRAWASVPRIIFFGPAVPCNYSSLGFGPSNYLLRASSAFKLFGLGLRSLELSSLGQQHLCIIQVRGPVPRIILFGPAAPQLHSSLGSDPFNSCLSTIGIFVWAPVGLRSLKSLFRAINALRSKYPNFGGNIPVRMPYVKYEGKSTVCNTKWPGIRIKRALPRNFSYLRYEVCTDGRIRCHTMNWASTW